MKPLDPPRARWQNPKNPSLCFLLFTETDRSHPSRYRYQVSMGLRGSGKSEVVEIGNWMLTEEESLDQSLRSEKFGEDIRNSLLRAETIGRARLKHASIY